MHSKQAVWDALKAQYMECARQRGQADQAVFGAGNLDAKILLVGEAPGAQEVEQRRPFVGKAGENLDEFLKVLQLDRAQIYITNAVKFRPRAPGKRPGGFKNRPPSKTEIQEDFHFLSEEIRIIAPRLIVTLGNVPLKALLGERSTIGALHGRATQCAYGDVFALYHPASIVYNPALKTVYHEDLAALFEETSSF